MERTFSTVILRRALQEAAVAGVAVLEVYAPLLRPSTSKLFQ